MSIPPVIHRELRAAARRRETWRLRMVFGLGAALAFVFGMFWPHTSPHERGLVVLICLAIVGFVLSLFAGAYLTADAVSAEKREGTLGLLFLTPLRGWQIITGKLAMHSVQVGYALLGGFPLFFLPLLLGGVMWNEVVRILAVLLLALSLSLAAGIFFSTLLREARNAVLATAVSMLLLALLPWLPWLMAELFGARAPVFGLPQLSPMTALMFAFDSLYRSQAGSPALSGNYLFWGTIGAMFLLNVLLIAASGWLLPRVWRRAEAGDRPLAAGQAERLVCRKPVPLWALPMERAPLLWLAARDLDEAFWLRLVRGMGLVFFAVMLLTSVVIHHDQHEFFIAAFCAAYGLHLVSRVQLLLAATRRWHEDRQSGALEAILATPVSEPELMAAHDESLARTFRRPMLVLLAVNFALEEVVFLRFDHLDMDHGTWAIFTAFFMGGALLTGVDFSALRWVGLRESLRRQTQLKAVGRAFLRLSVIPWAAFGVTFLVAIQTNREYGVALLFTGWAAACFLYKWILVQACRSGIEGQFRRRVAEG